ncbi:DUF3383 family protein [Lacticaseibacillus zhaodongensis]|uniref:DUF3383 family protein n=1 Tax=Lacticaseibacillus zhaodongensis TaxID=2668065 RepID=UPI0012D2A8DF|nr:DUF3383 family protein [Lacticaseibacillus zhaodongensis]
MVNTLSDVQIILDVQKPAAPVELGELAIFMPAAAMNFKTYTAMDDLSADVTDPDVLKVAEGYFDQDEHYKDLAIISYNDVTKALDAYFNSGWEFATLAGAKPAAQTTTPPANTSTTPTDSGSGDGKTDDSKPADGSDTGSGTSTTPAATPAPEAAPAPAADDAQTISNYIEIKKRRFFVEGLIATTDTADNAADLSKKYDGNERTILFASGTTQQEAEYGVGALIGELANQVVGSITWKFKTLNGVKPTDYTQSQVNRMHDAGIFTYVSKAGIEQTSEGLTVSGEFIDALHGDDWVKAEMESQLQDLLSQSKKISYDTAGIAEIKAVANTVLTTATANGIVLIDATTGKGTFTVTTVSRADTPIEDIEKRQYNGMSFTYKRSGAIHAITVHGLVQL